MVRRRTNPFFLSDGEVERERLRLQKMVRSIAGNEKPESTSVNAKDNKKQEKAITVNQEFWGSTKGLVIHAIVIDKAYNKDAILKVTELNDEEYRQAATELFQANLLMPYDKINGNLRVTRELYDQCQRFFQNSKKCDKP